VTTALLLATVPVVEYAFLPPICFAIALVTSAAHREDVREIWRHALRTWLILMLGLAVFAFAVTFLFEWLLPG
jgi:hypothetical protein